MVSDNLVTLMSFSSTFCNQEFTEKKKKKKILLVTTIPSIPSSTFVKTFETNVLN